MINTSTFTQVSYNFEVQDIMLSVNVFYDPKIRPWLEFVPDVASHVHVICAAGDVITNQQGQNQLFWGEVGTSPGVLLADQNWLFFTGRQIFSSCFIAEQIQRFVTGSRTISGLFNGAKNRYFKPNHNVFDVFVS